MMPEKIIQRLFCLVFALVIPVQVFAKLTGFGEVANNLMEPVAIASSVMYNISLIFGLTSLFAALLKYLQHRENPLAHPISNVILLLVIGIILVLLPFIYKLTESGIPYHLN